MKKIVFIICGGPIGDLAFLQAEQDRHQPAGLICADGGARHVHALGLTPDLIVGDMDSLDTELQRDFVTRGSRIMRYPEAKDETDSELALRMALMMTPDEIRIYGALGARIDHTLANLTLLNAAADRGIETRLLDEWCEIMLVRRTAVIAGTAGQTVSLLAFGADATGVTLEGFEYPLQHATITANRPLGISNRLMAAQGIISVESGDLLVIRYLEAGQFPQGASSGGSGTGKGFMPMNVRRVLTIAGSDSGGGAGIQADLKTITALGGYGMSVITALTAQNTLGVTGIHEVPADFVAMQFDAVASDIGVDAAKTGMLASADIIRVVAAKVRQYGIEKLVVDPVMAAKGGARLIREDARETLIRELIPLAYVVTPNIPEAEVLSGMTIAGPEDMRTAAAIIHKLGARHVVIKGGHLSGAATDILYDGRRYHAFTTERIATGDTHGTGCTFSAAIATVLADGKSVRDAVAAAKTYIQEAIRHAWRIGSGHGPTNHIAPVFQELDRYRRMAELKCTPEKSLDDA